MSARVATAVTGERVAAVKTTHGSDGVGRLAHEASVLRASRHPGVVEMIDFSERGDGPDSSAELRTAFVGTHSLATIGPMSVERAAGVVAAVASIVADLHEIGVVHGRLEPAHVLIGPGGLPVLCGFAGGGRPGHVPPPGPERPAEFVDPACPPGAPLLAATDVFGLGTLLRALLAASVDDVEPIPEPRRGRLGRSWTGFHRRALLTLADHATADDPRLRPTARAFAATVGDTVPNATLGATDTPRPQGTPRGPRRLGRGALLAVGLGAVILGVQQLSSGGEHFSTVDTFVRGTEPSTLTTRTTSTTLAPTTATTAPTTTLVPEAVGAAPVIESAGVRYSVGRPGDEVAVGDWDCDGHPTAAVVRPATGEVFVFASWAAPGEELTVTPVLRIPGARDPTVDDPDRDGCPALVVSDASGQLVEVPL